MDNGLQYLDIIFFALVAGFLILRLRAVLGQRTGEEDQRPRDGMGRRTDGTAPAEDTEDTVVPLPRRPRPTPHGDRPQSDADIAPDARDDVAALEQADSQFEAGSFLEGARAAYGMVLDAYAQGDRDTLGSLLDEDVYQDFDKAISAREEDGDTLSLSIESLDKATLTKAVRNGTMTHVSVTFQSEQERVLYDRDGNAVDGEPGERQTVTDVWTFSRDVRDEDPNWTLSATRSGP